MGKDIAEKELEYHNDVFADIINVVFYDGKQIVKPNELIPVETDNGYKLEKELRESIRDVAKICKQGQYRIALYGIENQSKIDKYMPLRIIGYDGISYLKQIKELKKNQKVKNNLKLMNNEQEIYPVKTVVLYFGKGEWKKPCCLHDCFEDKTGPDYKIKIISLSILSQNIIDKFNSDFKIIADFVANHDKRENYSFPKSPVNHVEDVLNLLEEFTGDNSCQLMYNEVEKLKKTGGKANMDDFFKRAWERSEKQGMSQGLSQGILEGSISVARKMLVRGKLTNEEIAEDSNLPLEKVEELAKELLVTANK